jgi:outer membrane protein assembly factor BamA
VTRLGLVVLLAGCATPRAAEQAPAAPPVAPTACPTQAPAGTTFSPEGVLGARVEQVCLVGAGDETSLRLREAVAPREGSTLDAAGVRSDLGALFDTGLISQASAFAEPSGPNAVFLTYVVVERGLINRVRVEGAASLSAERRQLLDGKGFRDTVTQRNQRRALLQDFYDSSGFHDATFDLRAAGDELIITVVEGPRFVVHGVAYEGAKAVPAKDLEKVDRKSVV